jgi:hypothetical protein
VLDGGIETTSTVWPVASNSQLGLQNLEIATNAAGDIEIVGADDGRAPHRREGEECMAKFHFRNLP